LAILLALPAACHSQPPAAANAPPAANVAEAPPPRNDLQVAEDTVRRQLHNEAGLGFATAEAYRDDRIAIVCGAVTRGGHSERYIVVDGRGAWVESEMRPGEMERAVREFCRAGARRPQGRAS
jgi:hypothetical protein